MLDSVNEEGDVKPSNGGELPTNGAIKLPNEATKPLNDTWSSGNVYSSSNEVMTPILLSHPGNPPRIFPHS